MRDRHTRNNPHHDPPDPVPAPAARQGSSALRRSLRLVTLAWVFGAVWMYVTTGAVLTRFAQYVHMPLFGYGILAALPFAGALMQLPTSYALERFGHRKKVFIVAGIIHRLMWIAIALIPWWLPPEAGWKGLLVLFALSSCVANVAAPAVLAWMADLVPGRIRGRYLGRRLQIGQMVGLIATVAIGYALDRAEVSGGWSLPHVLSVTLVVAGLCGAIDFAVFIVVPDPPTPPPDPDFRLARLLKEPLKDSNFRRFLGFTAFMTFAIGYISQFIWLYLFEVVHMGNAQANMMLVAVPLLLQMFTYPVWGKLIDRLGRKPVLVIAGLLTVNGATAWMLVSPEDWWVGYIAVCLAASAWPGVELTNLNIVMHMSAAGAPARLGSAYIAINSMVVGVTGVASGIFGGVFAEHLADFHGSFAGLTITYHGLLFLISAALRLASVVCVLTLREPTAAPTSAAIRYMAANIYSNMQQAVFMPTRSVQQLRHATYRLIRRNRPWTRRAWTSPGER